MDVLSSHVLKNGKELVFIRPGAEYSEAVVDFIATVNAESPFLGRDLRDKMLSVEEMRENLDRKLEAKRETFFLGLIDGEIAVECSVHPINNRARFAHRSIFGLVVLKKYWGIGIGRIAVTKCIELSKKHGYEQLELHTTASNETALGLYKSLGFEICGTMKNAMKYADGSYADEYVMVKYFE
jgi:ribosomal protein S18 acetylase RimI-like enzyme